MNKAPLNYHKPKECMVIKVAPWYAIEYPYHWYKVSTNIWNDGCQYITLWRD